METNNVAEQICIMEDNRNDRSFLPSGIIESLFYGKSLHDQREAYLSGKQIGFRLGVDFFKPHKLIKDLGKSCNSDLEKRFFNLLDLFFKRFGLAVAYHPNEGMIFQKFDFPQEDQSGLFYVQNGNDFQTKSKNELLQDIHLKIEQLSHSQSWLPVDYAWRL